MDVQKIRGPGVAAKQSSHPRAPARGDPFFPKPEAVAAVGSPCIWIASSLRSSQRRVFSVIVEGVSPWR